MKPGSRYVAFGVRSLSVATGLDHTTVAAHLRVLREVDDPLIDLIENNRGLQGTCTSCGSPSKFKTAMYGCAKPDLLRKRILLA